MNKEKLNSIKKRIAYRTPEIIVAVSAIALAAYAIYVVRNWETPSFDPDGDSAFAPFPEVVGEARRMLLEREDTIVQAVEPGFYFLSTPPEV